MNAVVASPRTLDEALAALAAVGPRPRVLAGGTDLMVELQSGRSAPERVVDIRGVPELRGIRHEDQGTRLGALTTCTELLADQGIARRLPLLRAAAAEFAAPQIRNRATVGGNLATASPAADLAPALLALGAAVRLRSRQQARDVPLERFFTGYRAHAGRPDELIESVFVPARPPGERTAFRKVGTRAAQSIAKVVVAVAAEIDGGRVRSLRGAAGSVADRTVALPALGSLAGGRPTPAAIADAATRAAQHDCAPVDDVRSTARYRRHALQRLLVSLLERLLLEE
jgi:CO/xanthine dehydrogenase FAD-binding subunit